MFNMSMLDYFVVRALYQRWREQEVRNASEAGFTLDNKQLEAEWCTLSKIAAQPGQPLEQLHIFVLAHILRRPIIVYGVKVVKSFRGEEISPAKYVHSTHIIVNEDKFVCWDMPTRCDLRQ